MGTAWDVIIIGGGPAGSTAATTLAKAGRRVLVLEKAKFPRFHIGESLLTYSKPIFEELGVLEKVESAGFMVKRGAQFWMGDASRFVQFVFADGSFTEHVQTFQVERAKFDDILLKHSQECGAVVREECTVTEHGVEGDAAWVKFRTATGEMEEARAGFMMDASGLSNFTGTREGLREYYPGHKKMTVFSHFGNVQMPDGSRTGDILIIRRKNSWFWMIPLSAEKTSVGLVMDKDEWVASGKKPKEVFDEAVASTKAVRDRMMQAEPLEALHVLTDFSYRNSRLASPRLVRVGDASGFIDPIFSSGVLLAMTSGQHAAREVDKALAKGREITFGLRWYGWKTRRRISRYWEFIENFYKVPFSQLFFQPQPHFRMVCAINSVLAGRVSMPFAAWWRLRAFFALVWLQQHVPVVRKIAIR
ncbi:NAD(P)/FAD-dependent oxidoreductase [Phragmitibacter flavus]|uniref:NAD(P)/FAD-dependent oxidoreductase n=1 Tax=Phragmitibacter flavus TaxID=2576071 RepID=A0A5R8K9Y5_9BACT|nr:NAD(P)/FAD-dependent oxidoreductase [Phragmitibacter flavus]TLD69077.1 NAD(P)/FAD-dependent oxidoreductase [Phragmitibacter flavus]